MNDIIVCSSAASFICFLLPPILLCVPVKTQTRGESSQSLREREGVNKRQKSRKRKSQEILLHKQLSLVECLINQQWQKGTTINKETPSSQQRAINWTGKGQKQEKKKTLRATVYFNSDPQHQAVGDQILSSDNTKFTAFLSSALLCLFYCGHAYIAAALLYTVTVGDKIQILRCSNKQVVQPHSMKVAG